MSFENISNIILLLTAFVASIYFKKQLGTPLRYLKFYLWYAVILVFGAKILWHGFEIYTSWWYNIGINIEILFYLFLFYLYIENTKTKRFILIGGAIYELYFLFNYLVLSESWQTYQTYPFVVGSLMVITVVFLFLIEMFRSDKILYMAKYLIFWVSLGLLFYNIIPLPFFAVRGLSTALDSTHLISIQYTANILMYLSFIYGFIWSTMKYK